MKTYFFFTGWPNSSRIWSTFIRYFSSFQYVLIFYLFWVFTYLDYLFIYVDEKRGLLSKVCSFESSYVLYLLYVLHMRAAILMSHLHLLCVLRHVVSYQSIHRKCVRSKHLNNSFYCNFDFARLWWGKIQSSEISME